VVCSLCQRSVGVCDRRRWRERKGEELIYDRKE
jgi:hypothetical protein